MPINNAALDDATSALEVIGSLHARTHEGRTFEASFVNESLGSAATVRILFRVGSWPAHVRFRAAIGGDARISLYEGPILTDEGDLLSVVNLNRLSDRVPETVVRSGVTVSANGAILHDRIMPGGRTGQSPGVQNGGGGFEEVVTRSGMDYLLTLENLSGAVQPASVGVTFYELGG